MNGWNTRNDHLGFLADRCSDYYLSVGTVEPWKEANYSFISLFLLITVVFLLTELSQWGSCGNLRAFVW
ncbi:hypothetical protein TOL_0654 [Thalassolituus oleivorans MIL-1]|uniref:Uncharacterized protein n=1 Tax=Thalassolituus oleivorans MIL-1 TaxID=1298593 RepID=M5DPN7_9GAMM|nr:hypothetical protein TOL_0654 [Thalassolituus oleivorans MIL-1]